MNLPSIEYRKTLVHKPDKVTSGLDAVTDYLVGLYHRQAKRAAAMHSRAEKIYDMAADTHNVNEHTLKARLRDVQRQIRRQGALDPALIEIGRAHV